MMAGNGKSDPTEFDEILTILDDVPDYQVFLTVDELKASTRRLAGQYPDVVDVLPVGHSRQGDVIEALKIGDGPKTALLFAMPHPNEPIGSMMLEFLSLKLAQDETLRETLGYTWYLIKCVDPDGTRLNEGWFKGPFSIENYARHFYRPPSHQQVEWSFPIDYKTLHFHDPLPETQALMTLIEKIRPDFIYSLHNAGFGGAYFYLSEEAPALYEPFHNLVKSQDLPLHLGEPEMPYAQKYADAIFRVPPITDTYDFLEQHSDTDPAEILTGGSASFEYSRNYSDPFCLVCEMPYFYDAAIHDTSPSDVTRREAILSGLDGAREEMTFLKEQFDTVQEELTEPSAFRDTIENTLQFFPRYLAAQENWAKTDPSTEEVATAAEKLDSLVITRFYRLLSLGMYVRMLDSQMAATGLSSVLSASREAARDAFEKQSVALEGELEYSVIPIRKLVSVQLGSALLAAGYSAGR